MLFLHILILPAVSNASLLSTGPWRKHSSVVKIDAYRFLTFVNYRNIQTHSKQRARAMCPAPSSTITSFGQSWVTHTPKAPNRAKQIPDSLSAAGLDVDTHILSSFAGRCGRQQVVSCWWPPVLSLHIFPWSLSTAMLRTEIWPYAGSCWVWCTLPLDVVSFPRLQLLTITAWVCCIVRVTNWWHCNVLMRQDRPGKTRHEKQQPEIHG